MTDKPKFWMVWSPRGKTRPSVRHASHAAAGAEATRLSKLFPGRHFYILEMIGYAIEGPELPNKKERARAADPARNQSGGTMDQDERNESTASESQTTSQPTQTTDEQTDRAPATSTAQGDGDAGTTEPQAEEQERVEA